MARVVKDQSLADAIRPCPFCGGRGLITSKSGGRYSGIQRYQVRCTSCHARGPHANFKEEWGIQHQDNFRYVAVRALAVDLWNNAPRDTAPLEG